MRVLVIGGGGREHALCWKLAQSPLLTELYCAPGNPGIEAVASRVPEAPDDVQSLADFAVSLKIDLTVVGPELPLVLGLTDELESRGLAVFGPRKAAAELEGSKIFAKELMARHGVPTAEFEVAHDAEEARRAARRFGLPGAVLKADGLAGGKGVLLPDDEEELETALDLFFDRRRFGTAGERLVVEERLEGEEVSILALSDGERVLPLATSKDYKRLGEGDAGPNTGGMGAHSPAGVVPQELGAEIVERIVRPTIRGLAEENRPFRGVLYAGLMLTADGPRVLEYNVRFGDPECQPLMMRLDGDLLPVLAAAARGDLGGHRLSFKKEAAVCVVLASSGYPVKPVRGEVVHGLDAVSDLEGVEVFHAGTDRAEDGSVVTAGGRVFGVTATGPGLLDALKRAYGACQEIDWPSKIYRRDIGRRVLEATAGEPR